SVPKDTKAISGLLWHHRHPPRAGPHSNHPSWKREIKRVCMRMEMTPLISSKSGSEKLQISLATLTLRSVTAMSVVGKCGTEFSSRTIATIQYIDASLIKQQTKV